MVFILADYREDIHMRENVPAVREEMSMNSLLQDKGEYVNTTYIYFKCISYFYFIFLSLFAKLFLFKDLSVI